MTYAPQGSAGVFGGGMYVKGELFATRETSVVAARDRQRMFREEPNSASRGGGEACSSEDLG